MLRNYIKIAYRGLLKNPVFSFINVTGLSLGIAAFMLILQYISFEASVNKFHKNLPDIYRVLFEGKNGSAWDYTAPIIGPLAKREFGEVNNYCRVAGNVGNGIVSFKENNEQKSFKENEIAFADGSFFEMFSFTIKEGNGASLKNSNTAVISESIAKKYFLNQSAIGKVLTINNQFGESLYTIVAVFNDFKSNSDLQYSIILSLQTLANPINLHGNDWASLDGTSSYLTTFLQLQPKTDFKVVEVKANEFKKKIDPNDEDLLRLQPLKNIHLASSLDDYYPHSGNLGFIYLLGGIALLILVIAWFNYINLSTASALKRAKEVGVRKVVGANKRQLIAQFLGESLILNLIGFLLALGLVNLLQTLFNQLIGKTLSLSVLSSNSFWMYGLLFIVIGSILSGAYTSFTLSSFNPAQTLKGVFSKSSKGIALRKALVVFQFSISILLIASTFILYRQLQYMQNENLGMNIDQLLVMRGPQLGQDSTYRQRKQSFKNELGQTAFISKYCGSASVPTEGYNYSAAGITKLNPLPDDGKENYNIAYIDNQFFSTYEIKLVVGAPFSIKDFETKWEEVDRLILNEKAITQLGFATASEAVSQKILWQGKQYEIIGVVSNYHHMSLRESIAPVIFVPQMVSGNYTVKLAGQNMKDQLAYLEKIYKQYFPGNPFDYFFVDDNYNRQYKTEQQYGQIFTAASFLAIFIACLGLFGLATFTVEQRTKEIGVRKVMGANVSQIARLLSKDFVGLIVISILIASPLAWWAMDKWLQEFAYRTEITIWIFALAGFITMLITFLTVGSQGIKAAMSNPVKSLRSE